MTDLVGEHWKTWTNLASAIVEAQIDDYKDSADEIGYILKKKERTKNDYERLFKKYIILKNARDFFLSDWCATLSIGTQMDGKYILEQLEKEYPIDEKKVTTLIYVYIGVLT